MVLEILVVLGLVLVNGFFAMAEFALVSARQPRLQAMAREGVRGAGTALELLASPARFLSAVQVGITLVGLLAGAFGGATLAQRLASALESLGVRAEWAQLVGVGAVVAAIGYLSLVAGELVPKQLALARAERIACAVAGPMRFLGVVTGPFVALLEWSSRLVLRVLVPPGTASAVPSEAEIKAILAEAERAGVVEPEEKAMIGRIMRLGDLSVRAVMTPRHELDWLDLDRPADELLERILASPHSRLPAGRGRVDEVTGVIRVKDVLAELARGRSLDLAALAHTPPAVHEGADVLAALEALEASPVDMIFVVDEYGTIEGIVTSSDLLAAIVGPLPAAGEPVEPDAIRREDGSWLLDGAKSIDAAAELLGLELPAERDYHTVAGFVLERLRRLPRSGDGFAVQGWRFEVVDMDGRRIDKVLASPLGPEEARAPG
ncbi:MAG: hemolysin family protein [Geminicoccaceae bacterium]|nr:hemolysin family protein [Geminicoccaceae bacterium]MDW8369234.1 hemolysin family protein [Geminicoccaceae bacterium]